MLGLGFGEVFIVLVCICLFILFVKLLWRGIKYIRGFFGILVVCLCLPGCGDEGVLIKDVLIGVDDAMVLPEIPAALQEALWGNRENMLVALAVARETGDTQGVESLLYRSDLRDRQVAYYTKYIDAGGMVIVGHRDVWNWHFYAARDIVLTMTSKHPRLREVLSPGYLHSFQWTPDAWRSDQKAEKTTFPSHRQVLVFRDSVGVEVPEATFDEAGKCYPYLCISSVGLKGSNAETLRPDMRTFVHEFAHAMHSAMLFFEKTEMSFRDYGTIQQSSFDLHLGRIYEVAHAQGIWEGEYADTNHHEYWAEGVVRWFYDIGPGREFASYEAFFEWDRRLGALLDEWFPRVSFSVD